MTYAIARPPARSIARAINSWYAKSHKKNELAIDYHKARRQHQQFVATLERLGIRVFLLEADEKYPDGSFVQDPLIVHNRQGLVLPMAAPTRRGEAEAIIGALRSRTITLYNAEDGTCDGGDVLVGRDVRKVWVGLSNRTNEAGFRQIRSFYENLGYQTTAVPIENCLHLSTGASYLGDGRFLVARTIGQAGIEVLSRDGAVTIVSDEELPAANVLVMGKHVILPEGYSRTKAELKQLGFTTHETPLSEFEKADGSTTCLSLLLDV